MPVPLAVLIVEDMESDMQFIVRLLKKAGYELVYEQVETAAQMRSALNKRSWDIIISDYRLPQFDGHAALMILKELGLDIPFIIVSGAMGEETAVSMMKAGAQDYLMKDNLTRLIPAVQRELEQAEIRRERRQTEEALRVSEERYRTLVEFSPDGIGIHCEGKVVYVNTAAVKLLHANSPQDLIGMDAIQFVHPNYQAIVKERVRLGYKSQQPASTLEEKFITLDGQLIEVEVSAAPTVYNGKPATQIIIRDISKRKEAEEALAASEIRMRALVEQVPAIVYTESADSRQTLYISPQVERVTGYTPAEWIEDSELWKRMIHPEDRLTVVQEDQRTTANHDPFYVEYRIQTRDGRTLWLHDEAIVIKTPDEAPLFWQGVMYDITERKQVEEALRESQSLYHSLVESSPLSICRKDLEGRFTFANRRFLELSQITLADLVGKTDFDLHPSALAEKYRRDDQAILDSGQVQELIEERIIHGGETTFVQSIKTPIYDGTGKTNGIQISFWDITARKRAEELAFHHNEQLQMLYKASQRLNRTLDLHEIYQAICDFMSTIAPNDGLIISAFDSETQLITCRAYWMENNWLDVESFPPIPLEAEGKGTQSLVIRTGQSMLLNDYQTQLKTAQTSYYVNNETSEILTELPPDEEDVTRSALIVPIKNGGMVSGVIQVMSFHPNAYTEDQLKLLEALALHIASAEQNARLYAQVQMELNERKQAEKSLRDREEQYRTLVEQLPAIVFIDDAKVMGSTLYISPQIEAILGFTQQEWMERSPRIWMTQVHPDDLERVHAGYIRCFRHGEPHNAEYRIRAADGRMRWLRDQAVRLSDENGKPHLIHGVMYDITERKQAEELLQTSEKRYRELFNSMIDGFSLHEIICDENGNPVDYRFLELNPSFERMTGLKSENLLGKTVLEVLPNIEPYWIQIYGNVALTGRSTFFENYSGDLGRYFEVSVYCPRHGQFAVIMVDITQRKQAEDATHQRVIELEMLYQSGLTLSQLLNPKDIGRKILELLEEKLNWHHTRIRLYHPQDDSLELLDFNQPGLKNDLDRREAVDHFQTLITRSNQGMSGWVIQHGLPVRSGDVTKDPRYVEAYPGIHSGLYVPMKLGERVIGEISIEDEQPDAFSEADERLIVTLASQAASAFENARLFEETRQRVMELETLNRISLVLRAVSKQNEMLSIVLDEALAILNTSHGSIEIHNKITGNLDQTILRGWIAKITAPHRTNEGVAGKVFTSGETYISREFASDPETRAAARSQIPPGWGGICLPIRTTQQTLGVMVVSMPSEHELNKNEIRLLSILSEMTGAALQRMQLHEQTVHHLEQLKALRAIDHAIASSRDMRLTLNILLSHTISQLDVDAANILLFHPDSSLLELVADLGFQTQLLQGIRLGDSFAGRAIMEHRSVIELDFEAANQNPQFGKLWKDEGFTRYWCVPLSIKGELKGALEVYRRVAFTPDSEWLEFLEALAGQASIAIDNAQLFENLQRANLDLSLAYDATIEGWSRAMDLRDHETEGHTLRVTDLTVKLARAMRVSESQLTAIRRGALLHDIGKMGVPDAILLKEGELTTEEWLVMRKHPELARDMLLPIAYLNDALNIPYCHHEKWDGTGYPQGLQGDRIPLVARIFAIVDVWDALTNDRTYRKKWTIQKARQYIKEQSGSHFDPQVVDVFLKNIVKM